MLKKNVRLTSYSWFYNATKSESTQNRENRETKSGHSRVKPTTTCDPSQCQADAFECAVASEGRCDVGGGGGVTSAAFGSVE